MFTKSSFGLDISDESIKFIELIENKNTLQVGRYGERKIGAGVIEHGEVKDPKKLQAILISIRKTFGLKSAHIAFSNREIEDKQKIKSYLSVFKNSGIKVKSFTPRLQATLRSVLKTEDKETYMIINLHENDRNIFIVSGGGVAADFPLAADTFPLLQDEVARRFLHWHTRKKEGDARPAVKKIILSGGNSGLTELSEYLSAGIRHKVEVANVWTNILDIENYIPEISFEESPAFAPALGLALSDFF